MDQLAALLPANTVTHVTASPSDVKEHEKKKSKIICHRQCLWDDLPQFRV